MATKTGTFPEVNQNSVIRIKATRGVALITCSGKEINALTKGKSADKSPVKKPRISEIKKAEKTLRLVIAKASQKVFVWERK